MQTMLAQPRRAGVYAIDAETSRTAFTAASALQFKVWRVDLAQTRNARSLQSLLGRALQFPDWFGENWDALLDCLCDLSWCAADGYLLILDSSRAFDQHDATAFDTLLEVLRETNAFWQDSGLPFWAMLVDAPAAVPFLPPVEE